MNKFMNKGRRIVNVIENPCVFLSSSNTNIENTTLFTEGIGIWFAEHIFEHWAVADLRRETNGTAIAV